jgi:hypothetical protein
LRYYAKDLHSKAESLLEFIATTVSRCSGFGSEDLTILLGDWGPCR